MPYDFSKERVIEAIQGSFGIMSKIARALDGCAWHTAYRYVNIWSETRLAYADENERSLDLSESKMIEQIANSDGPMIRFHLTTKGRHRGYGEHQDITLHGEVDVIEVVRATKSLDTDGRQSPDAPA